VVHFKPFVLFEQYRTYIYVDTMYFESFRVLHDELPHTVILQYEYLLSREDELLSILAGCATFFSNSKSYLLSKQ
jgi:hypothetical protein